MSFDDLEDEYTKDDLDGDHTEQYENYEDEESTIAEPRTTFAAVRAQQTQASITKTYQAYLSDPENNTDALFGAITSFAESVVKSKTWDLHEGDRDADDHAQEITMEIWEQLSAGKAPENFFSWLSSACHNRGRDSHKAGMKRRKRQIPLEIEHEDGDRDFNPALLRPKINPSPSLKLPDWIQGDDKRICDYIRSDLTYEQIAKSLGLTEAAVKRRVSRMKERNMAEAAAKVSTK